MQIQTVLKMILQLVYTVKTVYLLFYDYVYILFVPYIAVAFYTTVSLFSAIVYIQQTHTFLGLIYTSIHIHTQRPFIKQMTLHMNIHSLLHFFAMLLLK